MKTGIHALVQFESGPADLQLADEAIDGNQSLGHRIDREEKELSRATAPSSAGPSGAMKHGVVISVPFSDKRASATGQTSRWPPAITTR